MSVLFRLGMNAIPGWITSCVLSKSFHCNTSFQEIRLQHSATRKRAPVRLSVRFVEPYKHGCIMGFWQVHMLLFKIYCPPKPDDLQVNQWDGDVLRSFWRRWYYPANCTLYVVGDLDRSIPEIEALVRNTFDRVAPGRELPEGAANGTQLHGASQVPAPAQSLQLGPLKPRQLVRFCHFQAPPPMQLQCVEMFNQHRLCSWRPSSRAIWYAAVIPRRHCTWDTCQEGRQMQGLMNLVCPGCCDWPRQPLASLATASWPEMPRLCASFPGAGLCVHACVPAYLPGKLHVTQVSLSLIGPPALLRLFEHMPFYLYFLGPWHASKIHPSHTSVLCR